MIDFKQGDEVVTTDPLDCAIGKVVGVSDGMVWVYFGTDATAYGYDARNVRRLEPLSLNERCGPSVEARMIPVVHSIGPEPICNVDPTHVTGDLPSALECIYCGKGCSRPELRYPHD